MTRSPDDGQVSPGAPGAPGDSDASDGRGSDARAQRPSVETPRRIAFAEADALARLVDGARGDGATVHGVVRALIDAAPLAMWILGRDGRVIVWNQAAERLTGWKAEETIGRPMPPIVPSDKAGEFKDLLDRALRQEVIVDIPVRRQHKDGRSIELGLSSAALVAPDGEVVAILVMATDQTSRREAEESERQLVAERAERKAVDAGHHRLSTIVEGISDLYTAYDRQWRYTYMNTRAAETVRATGRDPDALIGQVVWEAYPEIVGTKFHSEALRSEREGRSVEFDEYYPPLDQTFNVRVFPLADGFVSITRDVSDRRRAERALERSEARFRSLVQASSQIVWTTDAEGRVITPIPEWTTLTGQSFSDAQGLGMLVAVHPDDRNEVERLWLDAVAAKQPFTATFRLRVADDSYRWFAARGVPVLNADGSVREWVGTTSDIHERKTTESALLEGEARFREMADKAPVMLWVTEPDGHCSFLNQRWYDFTGQTPETGLGFGWLNAVHPDDVKQSEEIFVEANKRHEPFRLDYRLRRHDGVYRWAIDTASPRLNKAGEFLGYVGTVVDIDERRQMEDALRASETRHRRIFETAEVAIFEEDFSAVREAIDALHGDGVTDMRRYVKEHPEFVARAAGLVTIRDVNEACVAMFGARDKRQLMSSLDQIFVPETLDVFAEEIIAIAEQQQRLQSEAPLRTLDGRRLQVAFTIAFPPDDPELRSVLVSLLDITDRKRNEAERERLLAAERAARTEAESARREADAARAIAEQASRAKSDFLATMSHELRTPLNAIIGYQNLLADGVTGPISDAQRRQLERIGGSAHHLLGLIDEVLTLSRVEAGKEKVVLEPVDISRILDEAGVIIEPLAREKTLDFQVVKPDEPLIVQTDPGKLRQAVLNLLSNAVKFTGRGSVVLRARRDEGHVLVEVQDTGIGISTDHQGQIFEPFWQVEGSSTRTAPGTGLGLAVTRRLAHLLGGEVFVESAVGEGSTFRLRIPLHEAD